MHYLQVKINKSGLKFKMMRFIIGHNFSAITKILLLSKLLKTTNIENDWLIAKKTISIKITKSKNRFQVSVSFDISITLLI